MFKIAILLVNHLANNGFYILNTEISFKSKIIEIMYSSENEPNDKYMLEYDTKNHISTYWLNYKNTGWKVTKEERGIIWN